MRVAIVHDWFVSPGGAENVIGAMLDVFPDADIFSVVDFFDDVFTKKISSWKKNEEYFYPKVAVIKKKISCVFTIYAICNRAT